MASFPERAGSIVATAAQIARLQGAQIEATVLERAISTWVETGWNDWNGGVTIYTLMLEVPIPTYAAIAEPELVEKEVFRRVSQLIRAEAGSTIDSVIISPQLADSARPVEPPPDGAPSEDVPSFWQPGFFRVFITHLASQKAAAHRLKEALAQFQIAAFVAHDDIEPTREWQAEIERALRTMDALVAIVAPGFVESRWCDQEVGIAIGRGKLVLPIRAGADPHGFMARHQALSVVQGDAGQMAERVGEVLIQHSLSSERMTEALVDRLAASGSWESSKRTMGLLEKAPRLNSSQVAKLFRASDERVDVRDAWGVPERIKALVAKLGASPAV